MFNFFKKKEVSEKEELLETLYKAHKETLESNLLTTKNFLQKHSMSPGQMYLAFLFSNIKVTESTLKSIRDLLPKIIKQIHDGENDIDDLYTCHFAKEFLELILPRLQETIASFKDIQEQLKLLNYDKVKRKAK